MLSCCGICVPGAVNAVRSPQPPEAQPKITQVSFTDVMQSAYREPDSITHYGPSPLQQAFYWASVQPRRATVIFVHGGCWLNSFDVQHAKPLATALSAQGYDTWAIEYRRTGDSGGGWPGSRDDVIQAVDHLLPHVITSPVILMGHSAGGHLALLAASHHHQAVSAVIGLAAITNVSRYAAGDNSCQQATTQFMGGTPEALPTDYQQADVNRNTPHQRTVLLHGESDLLVPVAQAELSPAQRVLLPDVGHFDWIHPDSLAFQTLLSALKKVQS